MKIFRKPQLLALQIVAFAVTLGTPVLADSVVTDRLSGTTVSLASDGGKTLVTHLATGESIEVEGTFEGMTDEEYTQLMKAKRIEEAAAESAMVLRQTLAPESSSFDGATKSGSTNGTFSISQQWQTYDFYVNSTSVRARISQNLHPTTIQVELKRKINWWPDKSYGKKSFSPNWDEELWTGLPSGAYYYLIISKTYSGSWTTGSWSATW